MADIDRVELLIGLSNNLRTDNDAWRKEVFQEGRARALRVREMMNRFEQEYGALSQEMDRLNQYLPRRQEEMPRVVAQGPASNEPVQRQEVARQPSNNEVRR
jgi:hypothetical protein